MPVLVSSDIFKEFAEVIRDHNQIHQDPEKARANGFAHCPAFGVLLQAYAEDAFMSSISGNGDFANFVYAGHDYEFKRAAFNGDELLFNFELNSRDENSALFKGNLTKNGKLSVECPRILLARERKSLDSGLRAGDVLFRKRYSIDKERANKYTKLAGLISGGIPFSLIGSLVPAALLEHRGENASGIYLGAELDFISDPEFGEFEVEIYKPVQIAKPSARIPGNYYLVNAVCKQEDKAVLSGRFKFQAEQF